MSRTDLIHERVRERGFASLGEYLAARRGVGVVALADELGRPIVGVDVVRAMLTGAHGRGPEAFREAAIDLLARHIREVLPNGWGRLRDGDDADTDVEIVNISPWSIWSTQLAAVDDSTENRAFSVFEALKATARQGWRPEDGSDRRCGARSTRLGRRSRSERSPCWFCRGWDCGNSPDAASNSGARLRARIGRRTARETDQRSTKRAKAIHDAGPRRSMLHPASRHSEAVVTSDATKMAKNRRPSRRLASARTVLSSASASSAARLASGTRSRGHARGSSAVSRKQTMHR